MSSSSAIAADAGGVGGGVGVGRFGNLGGHTTKKRSF
jgi:hypothetical protein